MKDSKRKSDAYIDGWLAHKNDAGCDNNPYSENLQAKSYAEWLDGWGDRYSAIKHELDLSLDDGWQD